MFSTSVPFLIPATLDAPQETPLNNLEALQTAVTSLQNDARLSNQRIPTDNSVTDAKVASNAAIAWSKLSKVGALPEDVGAATAAQGTLANTALQPGAAISTIAGLQAALDASTGSSGSVSAAGGLIIEATPPLSTTASQIALRNDSGILKLRDASNGLESTIATLDKPQTYTKAQRPTPVALTDGATISVDANLSNMYTITIAGNRMLANPTGLQPGSNFEIEITRSTGSETLVYDTAYKFSGGGQPPLSTTAGVVDILSCRSFNGSILRCDLGKAY